MGGPARGIDVARSTFPGGQVDELGKHPRQSRSGGRHHGCRGMDRGCGQRSAADLRRLPSGTGPAISANWLPGRTGPGSSVIGRDLLAPSRDRPGHANRPGIRLCPAVPHCRSAVRQRVVAGPTVAILVLAQPVRVALA
jgi:hypothetical protein